MSYSKDQLIQFAIADANKYGIDSSLFQAQINQESGWNPNALSPAGAEGIAQFMPGTAAGFGLNPWDPVASLQDAALYDSNTLHSIGAMAPYSTEDYKKMLAAYNEGGGALNNQIAHYGADWLAFAPLETQNYVKNILAASGSLPPITGIGTGIGPVPGAIDTACPAVTSTADALANIQSGFAWVQNNAIRVALFVLALALIGAGLFAIGGAVE